MQGGSRGGPRGRRRLRASAHSRVFPPDCPGAPPAARPPPARRRPAVPLAEIGRFPHRDRSYSASRSVHFRVEIGSGRSSTGLDEGDAPWRPGARVTVWSGRGRAGT
ncbi:MAG: hypothetical protein DI576_01660 [Actinomyces sp.]|nr:MAG: hypothetical protein DI576_01660 [Actinomyces sp.]